MANCRSCGAAIIWATTTAGKRMPLDPKPISVAIGEGVTNGGTVEIRRGYVSHFATCPSADQHRKPK